MISGLRALVHLYGRIYGDWAERHRKREATLTRLLAVQEAALGDQHPDLAGTLQELAWEIGKCRQAERAEVNAREESRALDLTSRAPHPDMYRGA